MTESFFIGFAAAFVTSTALTAMALAWYAARSLKHAEGEAARQLEMAQAAFAHINAATPEEAVSAEAMRKYSEKALAMPDEEPVPQKQYIETNEMGSMEIVTEHGVEYFVGNDGKKYEVL